MQFRCRSRPIEPERIRENSFNLGLANPTELRVDDVGDFRTVGISAGKVKDRERNQDERKATAARSLFLEHWRRSR
jgi:hypothetical protein